MKQLLVDGRLGRDAELRVTANGKKYVTFSLANNTHIKNEDKTTWYDVVCFDQNTVENRLDYLKKGKYIFVCGVYDTKGFVAKDGTIRVNESILADRITFINSGNNNQQSQQEPQAQQSTNNEPTVYHEPTVTTGKPIDPVPQPQYAASSASNDEEELPF